MDYSLSTAPSKVSVVIARRLNLPFLLFFPLWLAVAVTLLLKGHRSGQPQSSFAIIWFGLVFGLGAYVWLWQLGGNEKLEFTDSTLTWKRTLLGISRNRIFRMNRIDNPHFENSRSRGKSRTPSGIGFSYEGKALRAGDHLTQRDAKEIVAAVLRQLPELGQYWGAYTAGLPELDEDMSLNLRGVRQSEQAQSWLVALPDIEPSRIHRLGSIPISSFTASLNLCLQPRYLSVV